jgi:hypothetical protein
MRNPITLAEIEDVPEPIARSGESSAPSLEPGMCTLRFRLVCTDPESLEALRYARRSMLREEWTRGDDEGEASLEGAVFSASEVVWSVPALDRERCREKLAELIDRANRTLAELTARRAS